MQTRRSSILETAVNTVAGCVIGFMIVYSTMKFDPNPVSASAWIVALNVPASAARQYAIRRLFNGAGE
jgi:hypothetical protein